MHWHPSARLRSVRAAPNLHVQHKSLQVQQHHYIGSWPHKKLTQTHHTRKSIYPRNWHEPCNRPIGFTKTHLFSRTKTLQTRVNNRMESAQERYKQDKYKNVCRTQTFQPGKMVHTRKPSPNVSSFDKSERLAMASYKKLMPKEMEPFAIVEVQTNTLTIDKHFLHSLVSIDRATLDHGSKPLFNASQSVLVKEELDTKNNINTQTTRTPPFEYAIRRVVSHKCPENNFHFQIFWNRYSPKRDTLKPAKNFPRNFQNRY